MTVAVPPEAYALHFFQLHCADIAYRLRHMKGAEMKPDKLLEAACFLALKCGLYPQSYDRLSATEDAKVLRDALIELARYEPDLFVTAPDPNKPFKMQTLRARYNDCLVALDYIDPALGFVPGNVITVSERAVRIRDSLTVTEMEFVTEFWRQAHAFGQAVAHVGSSAT